MKNIIHPSQISLYLGLLQNDDRYLFLGKSWKTTEDSTHFRILPSSMPKSRRPRQKLTSVLWLRSVFSDVGDALSKMHFNLVIYQIAALKAQTIVYFGMHEWEFASSALSSL